MRYCLLMHYQEGSEVGLTEEDMAPAMAAFQQYADDLSAAGVLIDTEVLESVVATTTVTAHTGTPEIQDGPFADTKEKLGGIFVIEVDNLDEALKWAQRNPANAWGWIEIRPVAWKPAITELDHPLQRMIRLPAEKDGRMRALRGLRIEPDRIEAHHLAPKRRLVHGP